MIRKIVLSFVLITYILLNVSAQEYVRVVDWNLKTQSIKTDSAVNISYLFFTNAVYDDIKTMVPSYFELFPISSSFMNVDDLKIIITDKVFSELTDDEKKKIKSLKNIESQKERYGIQEARKQNYLTASIPVIRLNSQGRYEKLVSFTLRIEEKAPVKLQRMMKQTAVANSVLNSGRWVKVAVKETGIHKITYSELQSFGFSNLENVSIWGNGGRQLSYLNNDPSPDDLSQIPIYVDKGNDGVFNQGDFILFFAEGSLTWNYEAAKDFFSHSIHLYSKEISYFITTDKPSPLKIIDTQSSVLPFTYQTNAFDELVAFELNDTNLIKSGREWYGESFDITTTRNFDTKLSNPAPSSNTKIRIRVAARSATQSSFLFKANGDDHGLITLSSVNVGDEESDFFSVKQDDITFPTPSGNLILSLTYNKPSPAANGWLDFISLNSRQLLIYQGKQMMFRDVKSVGIGKVSKFTISNSNNAVQVWDVSNINYPLRLTNVNNGSQIEFTLPTDTLRRFIAFDPSSAYSVSLIGEVQNQNLHGLPQSDLFIVTHPLFIYQANELADIHRTKDGLSVSVVTTEQVYNEFSSGNRDVTAIRNFMRMFYNRSVGPDDIPRYLLLFGDGSYDNLNDSKTNSNFIPTYQSLESRSRVGSYVTDDYFGHLGINEGDASGGLDIGIGRLPVSSQEQAGAVLNKIKQYYNTSTLGDWNNQICFIGDDEDGNTHMNDANTIADIVKNNHPNYNVQKIFFDAYLQQSTPTGNRYPDVNAAINNRVNSGSLIVNYSGHGNEQWLSHEKVLMLDDVRSWRNFEKLSLFVTATCEFSRFDDYNLTTTGEMILLTPNGGGIGLLSTTRIVYASANFDLNKHFFNTVFQKNPITKSNSDMYYRLGDIVRISKNNSNTGVNKLNFSLLGDPALMLKYPEKTVELTHINDIPIASLTDTIKALSKLKVSGKIINADGSNAVDYNGYTSVTLFDKEKSVYTLNNDANNPVMSFSVRENVLYKGTATVKDGQFYMNCIIPKDINYNVGAGRLSLFATNGIETGAGSNETILIGGIDSNNMIDNEGPNVNVFLNDTKFVSGGISDPNPKLIVQLSDSSGINTSGTGIGHDLVATISGKDEKTIVLNNFYRADKDSYQSGRAELQLSNLEEGQHSIKVKAWDSFNNSSTKEINFLVASESSLKISHLLNYPNPFTSNTAFYFEHNQPFTNLEVLIQIYSPSGKIVKSIKFNEVGLNGNRVGPIPWDGQDDYGDKIGRGVYFYRLRVRTIDGKSAEQQQKLVILK